MLKAKILQLLDFWWEIWVRSDFKFREKSVC